MTGETDIVYRTASPEETWALGQVIGSAMQAGDVLVLAGELAAGKTVLVKGLAAGLGIDPDVVHSPTFALLHTYKGHVPLHHFDLYRLEDPNELNRLGFDEIIEAGDGVAAVEWGHKFASAMPPDALWVTLSPCADAPDHRTVEIRCNQRGLAVFQRIITAVSALQQGGPV